MSKFLICKHCGNLVGMIHDAGAGIICCGEPMRVMEAGTAGAAAEKHLPVASVSGDRVTVKVGGVEHPMLEEHHIAWIYLETAHGGQRKTPKAGQGAEVRFTVCDDKPLAVYAYCNLHGLWKTEL